MAAEAGCYRIQTCILPMSTIWLLHSSPYSTITSLATTTTTKPKTLRPCLLFPELSMSSLLSPSEEQNFKSKATSQVILARVKVKAATAFCQNPSLQRERTSPAWLQWGAANIWCLLLRYMQVISSDLLPAAHRKQLGGRKREAGARCHHQKLCRAGSSYSACVKIHQMPPIPTKNRVWAGNNQLPPRQKSLLWIHGIKNTLTSIWEKGKCTHGDFSPLRFLSMKAQHDNLQPMAPIRSFEETWLYKVVGAARREVDASVCQAVAVQKTKG